MSLILASASPRRAQLLEQLGLVDYKVIPADIDESLHDGESEIDYVHRMAHEKGEVVRDQSSSTDVVISADTAVCIDGEIMGKPKNEQIGCQMLSRLSGRVHTVHTAVVVSQLDFLGDSLSTSAVTFRPLSQEEIKQYWQTGEPQDKAGAYAIQGLGAMFVENLQGSFSGVMGLPLYETAQLLKQVNVSLL
ncbi:MAG: Maf family protein [Pseudomonadota bacterium]